MYMHECEYCGKVVESLSETCKNCGGGARVAKNYRIFTFFNKLFSICPRCFIALIMSIIFFILVTFFSLLSKEKAEWYTANQYQKKFDMYAKEGFFPSNIKGKCKNDSEQFHAIWKGVPLGVSFFSHNALFKESYIGKNKKYISDGYSLYYSNIFQDCAMIDRYQATWIKKN